MTRLYLRRLACLLLTGLLLLVSCAAEDREERRSRARERQGIIAAAEQPEPDSPGMALFKAHTCNTCHGDDGTKPLLPVYPVIARQAEGYVLKQMLDIKSGARSNGQAAAMKAIVANVPDEDLAALATFIATELGGDAPIGTGVVDEESVGANLFRTKTCTACHGKDAVTPLLPQYPKIAGHGAEYATRQMFDIKSGARANGMAVAGMKGIMHLVTEEEITHLSAYLETLPR